MSAAPRPEYVTDVPYVRAFENDLSPSRLRLVAALNGFAPPPGDDFDYCELGSAHGDTTAALAAAYPRARFLGVDLNPEHIASADRLAARGELRNLRFILDDFESLPRGDLPGFDFMTAHGVVSWVSPQKRHALIELAAAKLKPGGLLHVSYNALPGWASVEPLRQLIAGTAALGEGDSTARARRGVELAMHLRAHGAEYFAENPSAGAMLDKMAKLGLAYVAHEYLHAHWTPMYFAQVAAEMAAAGLYFVGQLPLYLNYRDLAIPRGLSPFFAGVTDRVAFESLKDFALNEYFRRDVFVKGRQPRSDAATGAYLDETLFGPRLEGGPTPREARFPHHALSYNGEVFDALLPSLDGGAKTVLELASEPAVSAFELARVRDAVLKLALGEAIVPMRERTRATVTPADALYRVTSLYNQAALREGLALEAPVTLASVRAGTGVELSTVEALAVFVLTTVEPQAREAWLRARCERTSFRLTVRGQVVDGKETQLLTLLDEIARFSRTRLGRFVELGLLEPAS